MKKSLKFFAALSCAAVMALAFAACSSGSPDSSASGSSSDSGNSESTSASTSDNSESSSSTSSASGKFASVEEYVASEELQSQLSTMKESLASSGMDISITGEGNKLIYTYTYPEGTPTDGLADSLAAAIEGQTSTFKSVASALKLVVDVDSPVVVVSYVTSDGTEIFSTEFTAE